MRARVRDRVRKSENFPPVQLASLGKILRPCGATSFIRKEINDYGGISVTYAVEKKGNKVTHISFRVRSKKDVVERIETWGKIDGVLGAGKRGGQSGGP